MRTICFNVISVIPLSFPSAKTKPVSPKTAKNYLAFVSSVFTYAVQMRIVKENPCHAVTVALGERDERDCYTLEEAQQFLDLLANKPLFYQAFFTLAVYGGYRRGKLCGLEWKDIDFDTCVVSIRRTSLYTKAQGTFTDTTKTKSSKRSLKLPSGVIDILRKYRVEQNTHRPIVYLLEREGDKPEFPLQMAMPVPASAPECAGQNPHYIVSGT